MTVTQNPTEASAPAPAGDGRRPVSRVKSLAERSDVRVWTVAMSVVGFAALLAAIGALAIAQDAKSASPKGTVTAAAPASSIDFNATPAAGFQPRDHTRPSRRPPLCTTSRCTSSRRT